MMAASKGSAMVTLLRSVAPIHNNSKLIWLFWPFAFAFGWLIPLHPDPWSNFYNEIAVACSISLLGVGFAWSRKPFEVDAVALLVAGVSVIPLLQAAFGAFMLPQEAWVVALYPLSLAGAIALGRAGEKNFGERFVAALFAGLLIAALVSAALAFAQVLLWDWGVILAPVVSGRRPIANIGQPNELATLLILGSIGLLWLRLHGRLSNRIAIVILAILLLAVISTRSRTGWLSVVILHGLALFRPACFGLRFGHARRAVTLSLLLFALGIAAWESGLYWIELMGGPQAGTRFKTGSRPLLWHMVIDGILARPWLGYGWDQGRPLQLALAAEFCDFKERFQHAHNIILDLLMWNGVPLGLALIGAVGYWFVATLRKIRASADWLVMLAIFAFMIHAMLELPHAKAYFLLTVGLFVGILNARAGMPSLLSVRPSYLGLAAVVWLMVVMTVFQDFSRIREDLRAYRMRMAWSGIAAEPEPPKIYVLKALQSALVTLRIKPAENMDAATIDLIRRVATRYPIESALMLHAQVSALNGAPESATWALERLCLLFGEDTCGDAWMRWSMFQIEHPIADQVVFPDARCSH